jgi:hypothetical protein
MGAEDDDFFVADNVAEIFAFDFGFDGRCLHAFISHSVLPRGF